MVESGALVRGCRVRGGRGDLGGVGVMTPEERLAAAEKLVAAMTFDRDDGGLAELVTRYNLGASIWPNNFSKWVAYLAFVIQGQTEEIERLKAELGGK